MADETTEKHSNKDEAAATRSSKLLPPVAGFLRTHWLAGLLAVSVMLNALGVWHTLVAGPRRDGLSTAEYELGTFTYSSRDPSIDGVRTARFQLHLNLLAGLDDTAGPRLAKRRFRVEQGVEQLLRQAHGADFDDPTLSELKRQIQETVNKTIDLRAIADVIITNLAVERLSVSSSDRTETAESIPWDEDSAD